MPKANYNNPQAITRVIEYASDDKSVTVIFHDGYEKHYTNYNELPKYAKKFCEYYVTKVEITVNGDSIWDSKNKKTRKAYTFKTKTGRNANPEPFYIKHKPLSQNDFCNLEKDIITVCYYRMTSIKNACKNCCYRDATYENMLGVGNSGFKNSMIGMKKLDHVCYGCNDFKEKFNAYPDTFVTEKEEMQLKSRLNNIFGVTKGE